MTPRVVDGDGMDLSSADCLSLLRDHVGETGRVAYNARCLPAISAARYAVDDSGAVVIEGGAEWSGYAAGNVVAFEVDGADASGRWSVLIRGVAQLESGPSGPLVRLVPDLVSGQHWPPGPDEGAVD